MQAIVGLGVVVCLAWPSAQEARDTSRDVLADDSWQTELPVGDPPADRRRGSMPRFGGGSGGEVALPPSGVGGVLQTIVWTVLALVVVAIVVVLVRERAPSRGPPAELDVARPPVVHVDAGALGDADALAREGRFTEAIRVLLLRTFAAVGRRAKLSSALTSREVLAAVAMSDGAQRALGELVHAVEVSHFGGQPAGADDYARCVERYRAVLAAEGVAAS